MTLGFTRGELGISYLVAISWDFTRSDRLTVVYVGAVVTGKIPYSS